MAEETKDAKKPEESVKETPQAAPTGTKKKMPKVLKIMLFVVAGFVALIVGMGILFFTASSGATKASDEFLNALQSGEGETAYDLFSTSAMEIVPEEEFIAVVDQIGPILNTEEKKISTNVSAETGSDTEAVVVYEIEGTDGVTYVFAITMVKEDGEWKVLNFDSDENTEEN